MLKRKILTKDKNKELIEFRKDRIAKRKLYLVHVILAQNCLHMKIEE